jgi:hypothetical protein
MKNFGEYSAESAMDFIEAWEGAACRRTSAPPASGQSASVTRRT